MKSKWFHIIKHADLLLKDRMEYRLMLQIKLPQLFPKIKKTSYFAKYLKKFFLKLEMKISFTHCQGNAV